MKTNRKAEDYRLDRSVRTAGGYGPYAASQSPEALLRRAVLANLLWEDAFYEKGEGITTQIINLIPQVSPKVVADIAIEARHRQKLRHVPLFICREMARLPEYRPFLKNTLSAVIQRADEITEFMAMYWKDGRESVCYQVRKELWRAFDKFDAYGFAKYDRDSSVKFRDVMAMIRMKPPQGKEDFYKQIFNRTLPTPDTWEVALSSGENKKDAWTRLITTGKIPALAFLRNIRNMDEAKVDKTVIREGFQKIKTRWLLPFDCLIAAKVNPQWEREIEALMFRVLSDSLKLPGHTVLVVDVSGSMRQPISTGRKWKGDVLGLSYMDAAIALAMLAAEVCESISIYATAGSDSARRHMTALMKPRHGFALMDDLKSAGRQLGGGGIFTRQCLEAIREEEREDPARIMIFSDSQDCDHPERRVPKPFGYKNYIIDVSPHTRGINYDGLWTAEITGFSEHFLTYVAALEGIELQEVEQ